MNTTFFKSTSRTAAVKMAKELIRRELRVERLHDCYIKDTSATCGCGETQGITADAKGVHLLIAICKRCG